MGSMDDATRTVGYDAGVVGRIGVPWEPDRGGARLAERWTCARVGCAYRISGGAGGTGSSSPGNQIPPGGQRPAATGKRTLAQRTLRACNTWLLRKRGWDATIAMMVMDMGDRLDGPSIIDLITEARPGGRYGDD